MNELVSTYVNEAVKNKYSRYSAVIQHPKISTILSNGDKVAWKALSPTREIVNSSNYAICYANLLRSLRYHNFSKSFVKNIRLLTIDFETNFKSQQLPIEVIRYLVSEFKKDGIFLKGVRVTKNGDVSIPNIADRHTLYIQLCIYRMFLNEGIFSYTLYKLHKDHYSDLPITQILFYLKSVININKAGHWFISSIGPYFNVFTFLSLSKFLKINKDTLPDFYKSNEINQNNFTYNFLQGQVVPKDLKYGTTILLGKPEDWLHPIITDIFKNPDNYLSNSKLVSELEANDLLNKQVSATTLNSYTKYY